MESSWVKHFYLYSSPYEGYARSKFELQTILDEYQTSTHSHFIPLRYREKYTTPFEDIDFERAKLYISDVNSDKMMIKPKIPNDGEPFILLGSFILGCHVEPSTPRKVNKEEAENVEEETESGESKKVDCGSRIFVRRVLKFPNRKIEFISKYYVSTMLNSLHKELIDQDERNGIEMDMRYYVVLPRPCSHNHVIGKELTAPRSMDRRISLFIHRKTAYDNIKDAQEMRELIHQYVRRVLFKEKALPPMSNTKFWPTLRQIRSAIYYGYKKSMKDEKIPKGIDSESRDEPDFNMEGTFKHSENEVYGTRLIDSKIQTFRSNLKELQTLSYLLKKDEDLVPDLDKFNNILQHLKTLIGIRCDTSELVLDNGSAANRIKLKRMNVAANKVTCRKKPKTEDSPKENTIYASHQIPVGHRQTLEKEGETVITSDASYGNILNTDTKIEDSVDENIYVAS